MTNQKTGGMFSRLLNPETAKPKVAPIQQQTTQLSVVTPREDVIKQKLARSASTPLPTIDTKAKKKGAKDGKHQISGWIPRPYFEEFVRLYRAMNPAVETVEKQYMLGVAVDTFCKIIGNDVPVFKSEKDFKAYFESKLKDKL